MAGIGDAIAVAMPPGARRASVVQDAPGRYGDGAWAGRDRSLDEQAPAAADGDSVGPQASDPNSGRRSRCSLPHPRDVPSSELARPRCVAPT